MINSVDFFVNLTYSENKSKFSNIKIKKLVTDCKKYHSSYIKFNILKKLKEFSENEKLEFMSMVSDQINSPFILEIYINFLIYHIEIKTTIINF